MTTKQFYSQYWRPLFMTIIPTILLTGFAAYIGVKTAIAEIKKDVYYLEKRFDQHLEDFGYYRQKDAYQSESLFRLQMNQVSLAKDCDKELPYRFENINTRGSN